MRYFLISGILTYEHFQLMGNWKQFHYSQPVKLREYPRALEVRDMIICEYKLTRPDDGSEHIISIMVCGISEMSKEDYERFMDK